MFGEQIFQQIIGIPMGTNCAPLLVDLFLYSYESEFIQSLLRSDKKTTAKSFNFTYTCIDDVLSLNNPNFGDYLEVIYLSYRTQGHNRIYYLSFIFGFTIRI